MTEVALVDLLDRAQAGFWGTDSGGSEVDVRAVRNGDVLAAGRLRWDQIPLRGLTAREAKKAALDKGDIVITTSGCCGQVAFVDRDMDAPLCATNFVRALRPKRSVVQPRYLFWLLNSERFRATISPFVRGTTMKNLSFVTAAAEVRLPVPPMGEQRRIVGVLDQADELRMKRRAAQALDHAFGRALLADLVVGDPRTNPHRWPIMPLASVVDAGDRINYGVVQPGPDVEGGVPLIRVSDLVAGEVSHAGLKRIGADVEASYRRSRIRGDEVLLSCVGSIGMVALASEQETGFNIARAVARVPLSGEVSAAYVAAYLASPFAQDYFVRELRTVAQPTLNIKQIKELPLLLPPVEVQQQFERSTGTIGVYRKRSVASSLLLDGLFTSLQHRAFAGQL